MKRYDFNVEQKADEILEMIGKELGQNRADYMKALLDNDQPDPPFFLEDTSIETPAPVKTKGSRRTLRRVLILAAVLIVMMGLVMVTSEGVRLKISSLFFNDEPGSTRIVDELNAIDVTKVEVGYVPEGFELVNDEMLMEGYRVIGYQNLGCEKIILTLAKTDLYAYNVDNENFEAKEVKVNEHQAYMFNDNGQNIILWQVGDSTFQITGDIEDDELVKIAKNVLINP